MNMSHVHLGVKDLPAAVQWIERVLQVRPTFHNDFMASLPFGTFTIILDAAPADVPATLGFDSRNCDADFELLTARGAVALEQPQDRPWGARAAYLQGPGAVTVELEQMLS